MLYREAESMGCIEVIFFLLFFVGVGIRAAPFIYKARRAKREAASAENCAGGAENRDAED